MYTTDIMFWTTIIYCCIIGVIVVSNNDMRPKF